MKRVRLNIGALSASSQDGGTFMFFLYKQDSNKCIPVNLSPNEMHTLLVNFNKMNDGLISVHSVFQKLLREFRVELLENTIIRDDKDNNFVSELLFFDGEKEITMQASFVDGIILSKEFGTPIYTCQELIDKFGVLVDDYSDTILQKQDKLAMYKKLLKEAIDREDYENAAKISELIDKFTKP